MLEQPWPPPHDGPPQARDAHGAQWANDVRRRAGRPAGGPAPAPDHEVGLPGREPAARLRAPDDGLDLELDVDVRRPPAPRAGRERRPRLPARWVPREEWIPDPTPAPERRWSPEQDWVSVFGADRGGTTPEPDPLPDGRRWRAVVGTVAAACGLVATAVAALLTAAP